MFPDKLYRPSVCFVHQCIVSGFRRRRSSSSPLSQRVLGIFSSVDGRTIFLEWLRLTLSFRYIRRTLSSKWRSIRQTERGRKRARSGRCWEHASAPFVPGWVRALWISAIGRITILRIPAWQRSQLEPSRCTVSHASESRTRFVEATIKDKSQLQNPVTEPLKLSCFSKKILKLHGFDRSSSRM